MGLVRRSCNGSDVTRNPETWQDHDTVDAVSYEERCDEVSALRAEVERLKAELLTVTDVLQYLYDNTEPHNGQWRHESKAAFRAAEAVLSARDSEEE